MPSVLFRDALIVTMDENRSVFTGSLLVENDRIKELNPAQYEADQVIDCLGKVLIPGLIQAHVHLVQVLFRGRPTTWPCSTGCARKSGRLKPPTIMKVFTTQPGWASANCCAAAPHQLLIWLRLTTPKRSFRQSAKQVSAPSAANA
jgi:hypothetical protein